MSVCVVYMCMLCMLVCVLCCECVCYVVLGSFHPLSDQDLTGICQIEFHFPYMSPKTHT